MAAEIDVGEVAAFDFLRHNNPSFTQSHIHTPHIGRAAGNPIDVWSGTGREFTGHWADRQGKGGKMRKGGVAIGLIQPTLRRQ